MGRDENRRFDAVAQDGRVFASALLNLDSHQLLFRYLHLTKIVEIQILNLILIHTYF